MNIIFEKISLKEKYNYLAPDGSEIRLLAKARGGGFSHCTLHPGKTSRAVKHRTVEEIWYFLSGEGEMWQYKVGKPKKVKVKAGDSINIPVGNSFQFKNTGKKDLCILIATMPNWPGRQEAIPVKGCWK